VNHILTAKHGKRIAIIENEFGEVGIDDGLVITTKEEIFEMNNGCICCTVRQDLVRILGKLMRRKESFDHIIIETTGLADPAPVAQTFFVDDELKEQLYLDAIVTICDAVHLSTHLDEIKPDGVENESVEQVAFADRIVLNKIDLVTDDETKQALISKIRKINARARIIETTHAAVDIDDVLGIRAFDLATVVEMDDAFLDVNGTHEHDASVTSVGFTIAEPLNLEKLNAWIGSLLREKGVDIFRSKGILSIEGSLEKYVFQGVHMMMEMTSSAEGAFPKWNADEARSSRMIFIGRNLDRDELERGFKQCLAK
jgi:G3E family GTPase